MNDLILILFIACYFALEALHDFFVIQDVTFHSDTISPERKAWHLLSVLQAGLLFIFLGAVIFLGMHFNLSLFRYIAVVVLTRWVCQDNLLNSLRNKNLFYVEIENTWGAKFHWLQKKTGIPAEWSVLGLKLILLALIIVV